jgi:hypothetical protein
MRFTFFSRLLFWCLFLLFPISQSRPWSHFLFDFSFWGKRKETHDLSLLTLKQQPSLSFNGRPKRYNLYTFQAEDAAHAEHFLSRWLSLGFCLSACPLFKEPVLRGAEADVGLETDVETVFSDDIFRRKSNSINVMSILCSLDWAIL